MVLYNSQNQPIDLGPEVGQGGEAVVHQVENQPDLLAKVYTSTPRAGYDQKLQWMLTYPPDDPTKEQGHASIAWPLDLLYNDQNQFVGYLMSYIQGAVPLLEVFNPRLRARKLPKFDLRYLYRTARNLAITMGAIHAQGYVVGDVNESNILVTPSALVTMIDTDSFQVKEEEGARLVVYPCPVGKPEYTSPELQGQSFQQTIQKPEQDRFGLGILIFQLLMEGSHPFRAKWLASGDPPPIEERIKQGCFPHVEKPTCPVEVPRTLLSLDTLNPKLAYLMRACFAEGHKQPSQRPTPEVWSQALGSAERALIPCPQGHYYSNHLRECPYCHLSQVRQARQRTRKQTRSHTQPQLTRQKSATGQTSATPLPAATFPTARRHATPVTVRPKAVWQPCLQCGYSNPNDEIYCQHCTQQLCGDRFCPFCQKPTPERARYCTHCGYAL